MKKTNNQKKPTFGVNNYVEHSMNILDRIHELLDEKFDGKQKELAKKLGKTEAEISKWLNGVQNFTLFTIAKLEEAFDDVIIAVHTNDYSAEYVQAKSCAPTKTMEHIFMYVDGDGDLYNKDFINVSKVSSHTKNELQKQQQTAI